MINIKWLYGVIALLLLTNGYFILAASKDSSDEIVATVGDVEVTKEMWLDRLKKDYGQDVLKNIINREVVYQLAKKQGISIEQDVIEKEVNLYKLMYNQSAHQTEELEDLDEETLREEVKYILLLEELYTQDIVITEKEIEKYYEDMYYLSHIVVPTEEEIKEVIGELEGGSSFDALAMERSIDPVTSSRGGDIGYVERSSEAVPNEYIKTAENLEVNKWSSPIAVPEGYAVILLREKVDGKNYPLEDMKAEIRRQLALQQINGEIHVEHLWNELGVEWKYNE
jgi:foldase protein PrsA